MLITGYMAVAMQDENPVLYLRGLWEHTAYFIAKKLL